MRNSSRHGPHGSSSSGLDLALLQLSNKRGSKLQMQAFPVAWGGGDAARPEVERHSS